MTVTSSKIFLKTFDPKQEFQQITYIKYPIKIGQLSVQAFINLDNKVNTIYLDFPKKLSL